MRLLPKQSQWTRCDNCGNCHYLEWKPSPVYAAGLFIDKGCRICYYTWSKERTINSLVSALRSKHKAIKSGKECNRLERSLKGSLLDLPSEIVRECYGVAKAIYFDTFTKMWVRSLRLKERNP